MGDCSENKDKFLFERVSPSVLPEGNPPPSSEGGIRLFPRKKTNLFQIEDFRNGFVFDGNKNTLPPSDEGGVNRMVDGGRENLLNKNLPVRLLSARAREREKKTLAD